LLQQVVPVAIPTPGPQQPVRLVISALNLDVLVAEGDDWEAFNKGAGHHSGSANPRQRGNLVLPDHDDLLGDILRYIGDLQSADTCPKKVTWRRGASRCAVRLPDRWCRPRRAPRPPPGSSRKKRKPASRRNTATLSRTCCAFSCWPWCWWGQWWVSVLFSRNN